MKIALARVIARGLPLQPQVQWARTLGDQLAEPVGLFRGLGAGLVAMGGVALLLACAGIHAIVAFSLAQRRRELAIRIALGASRRAIAGDLAGRTARQLLTGIAAGAAPLKRAMDLRPTDSLREA